MSLSIISDLHIWGPSDPLYLALLGLIRAQSGPEDCLVLAGDIFDLLVGNKKLFHKRYCEFFESLKKAEERGVELHYIEGNHDFLLKRAFSRVPGMKVHPESVSLEIRGKRFYICHGDLVNLRDYGYLVLRAVFRSLPVRFLIWLMPGEILDRFGQWSSGRSRRYRHLLVTQLPAKQREDLRKLYRSFAADRLSRGYDFVVMGHCHDLDEMAFKIGGRPGQYVNVGFPRVHGSFLTWDPGEEKIHREKLPYPAEEVPVPPDLAGR